MDEVFVRRDLIEPARLRALSAKSDAMGFLQLGSHLAAIALSTLALGLTLGTWWCVPAFMLQGMLINFLYAGQHEMSHWTVFKTKRLNEIFGRIFGFVLFYPRDFDQIQHFAHHRYTQNWDEDGELLRAPYTLRAYVLWFFGPTYWYTRVARILQFACGTVSETYIPERRKADVIREARWHVAGYAIIAAASFASGSFIAVTYWLAPMVVMKFTHQLQNTIEHLGLEHSDNILENTRSTRTNALMRWLGWNMQYHTAHHAFPGVPFHKLAKLHAAVFTERGVVPHEMGYLAFQGAVIRALSGGKSEADYPDERAWIGGKPMGTRRPVAELSIYQSLWATERRISGTPELRVEERFDQVKAAGFDGMAIDLGAMSLEAARAAAPNYARSGLRSLLTAFPQSIEDLRPALRFAKEIGSPFVIVVGQVMPIRVPDMIEVIEAWLEIAVAEGMPIQFETHRNCITNDLYATLQLLDAIPQMRLSADLSHYVVDREMPCPPSGEMRAMISKVLARADSFQGRVAARGQIQLPLAFPQNRKWLELFLTWWEEGLRSFAARSGPDRKAVFLCELGPPDYALTDADGRELSDRDVESLALARHARDIWQRVRNCAPQPV